MTDHDKALAFLEDRNLNDGSFDPLIDAARAGRIKLGLIEFSDRRGLELLKTNNQLGRFDALIKQAESLIKEPIVYVVTA